MKMTVEETKKLLAMVKVVYPTAYKDIDKDTAWATVKLWHEAFSNVPFAIMEKVFARYVKKGKFAPTVAEFNEELENVYCDFIAEAAMCKSVGDNAGVTKYLKAALSISFQESNKLLGMVGGL